MSKIFRKECKDKTVIYLILDTGEQRELGYLKHNYFFTNRDRSKHFFDYYRGYWFNKALIDSLPNDLIVLVKEKWNKNLVYRTKVSDIIEHNTVYKHEW